MTEFRDPALPSADLLRAGPARPHAAAVAAEVRTNASLKFDPKAAPPALTITKAGFGALVIATVDLSWAMAEQVQQWLIGAPPAGIPGGTREVALKDYFETLETGAPPQAFVTYIGTYIATETSHASYTLALGMFSPVSREDYQAAWLDKLSALQGNPATQAWAADLVTFFKLIHGQATSNEQFLNLASGVGSLTADTHSMVRLFL